jgi:kynurenine formamidase
MVERVGTAPATLIRSTITPPEDVMALLDLSRTIYAGMPKIPILPEVEFHPITRIADGAPLNISELKMATHIGTHVDAPWHFVPTGKTIDQIPLEQLCGPATVVSVTRGPGEPIPAGDFEDFDVREGDIVLLHTGWGDKFESPDYLMHPYLSDDAAHWLVEHRVKMIGMDLITPDMPPSMRPPGFAYPVHHILLENEVLISENLMNLDRIAGQRVHAWLFPLKIRDSDAGQARAVAEVP